MATVSTGYHHSGMMMREAGSFMKAALMGTMAMSSRNTLLSAEERERALTISRTLFSSLDYAKSNTLDATMTFVEDAINAVPGLELEYYRIVDGNTLQNISSWEDSDYVVGCIALFCGKVRLIDNIVYKNN